MDSNLFQDIVAPNGHKYTQPLGLFINNEWRPAKSNNTITVISPRYGHYARPWRGKLTMLTLHPVETRVKSPKSTLETQTILKMQSRLPVKHFADRGVRFPVPKEPG